MVLLILAGVTINLLFSDTGLFGKVQEAKNTWETAEQSDINAIGELANANVFGDAVYETTSGTYNGSGTTITQSWYGDNAVFPAKNAIFFNRGGPYAQELGSRSVLFWSQYWS